MPVDYYIVEALILSGLNQIVTSKSQKLNQDLSTALRASMNNSLSFFDST